MIREVLSQSSDQMVEKKQSPGDMEIGSLPSKKRRHIGAGTFVGTFGTNLFIQACQILQGVMVARMLGPNGRGEYAAVILWPTLFAGFGVNGIVFALGRISAVIDDYASLIRSGMVLAFLTSIVSMVACYIAVPWILPESESHLITLTRIFILVIPLNRWILNLNAIDQGCGNFKQFNLIRSIINPVYVLLLVMLWILGMNRVYWCVIALLAGNLAAVVVWLILHLPKYSFFGELYPLKKIVVTSIPFGLAGIFQSLYLQIDKALMLWLLGTRELGFYTVALSASAVVGSITLSSGMVSFTMAAQADTGEGFEKLAKTFRISLLLWIFLGGLLAVVMPFVLPLVYGGEFTDAVVPAQWLIIGSALAGLANMLEQAMRGQGKAFIGLEGRAAGLLIMILLAIPLAKSAGIYGVCIAYAVGQLTCLLVIISRTSKHYGIHTITAYFPRFDDIHYLVKTVIYGLKKVLKIK